MENASLLESATKKVALCLTYDGTYGPLAGILSDRGYEPFKVLSPKDLIDNSKKHSLRGAVLQITFRNKRTMPLDGIVDIVGRDNVLIFASDPDPLTYEELKEKYPYLKIVRNLDIPNIETCFHKH